MKKKQAKRSKDLPILAAGASAALKTGLSFLTTPGVLANIRHFFNPKKTDKYSAQEIGEVEGYADWIAAFLANGAVNPARIGIDGLPGSGKSTLAKALSKRLGMTWVCLDYELPNQPYKFDKQNSVYEHYRLFRTQDLDAFDAIIFLDLPVERIREQLLDRGQGAITTELLDYDLLQKVGRLAFELAGGEKIRVAESRLYLKVRPLEGYRAEQNLDNAISGRGLPKDGSLCKEERLFLLSEGEARQGRVAYARSATYAMEFLENLAAEVLNCTTEQNR